MERTLRGEDETGLRRAHWPLNLSNAIVPAESIPNCFASAVSRFAPRVAINAPAGQWTYAELDRRAGFVASEILRRLGETPEPVALLFEHDAPLIAAILGALKAGKIYVALDPNHPPMQLATMLASSGARLLLADQTNLSLANSLADESVEVLTLPENVPDDLPQNKFPEISGDTGAWLMFTSGSTNTPKGVWQNHPGLVHEAMVYADLAKLVPDDRVSLITACGLSASGATLFGTLLHGATLCLFHLRSQGVERLAKWLNHERITIFHSVPTVFRHLARAAERDNPFASVRLIRLGGEPVLRGDVELYRRLCPDNCILIQSFSSTETGMISTLALDKQSVLSGPRISAGQPVRGVEVFLVDENNQPLKNGGEGKIAVRSQRLRQGYWRQPELTAEKFLSDGRDPGSRIFVSNDVGRFLPDGALEHLGRADQLVKIRGQRVDLGEIEAALLATGLVREAVAAANEDTTGEKRLAAYFVPHRGLDVSAQNFRNKLRTQLPEYMIPNDFVPLETLPLTTTGKVDRHALTPPPRAEKRTALNRAQRPRYVIDTRLKRIWETVLNRSPIARTDDFFDLGGTSLQSVEVLREIEELFGISLPPSTLVEYSTIEQLSARLTTDAIVASPSPMIKLRGGDGRPLFLIHSGQGDLSVYGLLTRRLNGFPIYGLQSAGLQGESWPLMSVPAMARRYLPEILARDPAGPYLLGGTCMGGLVAFELAQMLRQMGKKIALLAMLDVQFPRSKKKPESRARRIYVSVRTPLNEGWRMLRWKIIRAAGLGRNNRLLPAYRRFVSNTNSRASRFYQPEFYPGEAVFFITAGSKFPHEDPRLAMQRFAQSSRSIFLPGTRPETFRQTGRR